jgi:phosphate starvation-inducible PhoH-like protein
MFSIREFSRMGGGGNKIQVFYSKISHFPKTTTFMVSSGSGSGKKKHGNNYGKEDEYEMGGSGSGKPFHHSTNEGRGRRGTVGSLNHAPEYTPKGLHQTTYVEHLHNSNISIVLGVGPAGTGKTLLACNYAVKQFLCGKIEKIVLTRPVVCVEEDMGFLPGDILKKMDPYTRPLFDVLQESFSKKEIDALIHSGSIEISPLAFMRGRTFKNSFILADEMQNSSPNQMFMLATRMGEGSRMVITGDLQQGDRGANNGLADFLTKYKKMGRMNDDIRLVEFDTMDVMRSRITSTIIQMYDEKGNVELPYRVNATKTTPLPSMENNTKTTPLRFLHTNPPVVSSTRNVSSYKNNDCALIPIHHIPKSIGIIDPLTFL